MKLPESGVGVARAADQSSLRPDDEAAVDGTRAAVGNRRAGPLPLLAVALHRLAYDAPFVDARGDVGRGSADALGIGETAEVRDQLGESRVVPGVGGRRVGPGVARRRRRLDPLQHHADARHGGLEIADAARVVGLRPPRHEPRFARLQRGDLAAQPARRRGGVHGALRLLVPARSRPRECRLVLAEAADQQIGVREPPADVGLDLGRGRDERAARSSRSWRRRRSARRSSRWRWPRAARASATDLSASSPARSRYCSRSRFFAAAIGTATARNPSVKRSRVASAGRRLAQRRPRASGSRNGARAEARRGPGARGRRRSPSSRGSAGRDRAGARGRGPLRGRARGAAPRRGGAAPPRDRSSRPARRASVRRTASVR